MYKNQLQELAQRSCFNLPSYTCVREGPDHAPRFKAVVNFNGETFESPNFCANLRQAEHAAAEAALVSLSSHGASHSLAARILDETGVYKNLLQEIAQRVASPLPRYTTYRHGLGHLPAFTGIVELAGITFRGEPAKNKKQAEKNAALAAWLSLKQLARQDAGSSTEHENNEEQEQIRIARALQNYRTKHKFFEMTNSNILSLPFQNRFSVPTPRPSSPQRPTMSTSKILPLFRPKNASQNRPSSIKTDINLSQPRPSSQPPSPEFQTTHTPRFPVEYFPINRCRTPYRGIAPPVTIRTAVPVFSAPPPRPLQPRASQVAPPVLIRQAVPVFSPQQPSTISASSEPSKKLLADVSNETTTSNMCDVDESTAIKCLEQLEI